MEEGSLLSSLLPYGKRILEAGPVSWGLRIHRNNPGLGMKHPP